MQRVHLRVELLIPSLLLTLLTALLLSVPPAQGNSLQRSGQLPDNGRELYQRACGLSWFRRQHLRFNVGARIPLNDTDVRNTQVGVYLLWDCFEGGLFEGW
jgi:hypothetical protein